METAMVFDNKSKHLALAFKERIVTDSNFQLKVTGSLNTKTGAVDYHGALRKFFFAPARSTFGRSYNSEKAKFRLGAGVSYGSRPDRFLVGLTARKQVKLGPDVWVKASQDLWYDHEAREPSGTSRVQLSKIVFNFTDTQDVRLLGGYRANVNHRGEWTRTPYAQLRENNWSLSTTFKHDWMVRYEL